MRFEEVSAPEAVERIFAFRYRILDEKEETRKLLEGMENGLESDAYDAHSVHFAAYDEAGEVVACTRLIRPSALGLPTLNNTRHHCTPEMCDPGKLGEFSRIFVAPQLRSIRKLHPLFDTLKIVGYKKMRDLDIVDTVGVLEKPFFRLLNMLGFPYEAVGELQSYYGMRYPSRLNTRALYDANRELFERHGVV